jgi:signal transduction histidine kinase
VNAKKGSRDRSRPGVQRVSSQEQACYEKTLLERQLAATREHLYAVLEAREILTRDLQSANGELQNTLAEWQAASGELRAANEELTRLNQQLEERNNDLSSLLSSVNLPVVMLGRDLAIRQFTPRADKLFKLTPADLGRPLSHLRPAFPMPDLEPLLAEVIHTASTRELEVQDGEGRWYCLQVHPYQTQGHRSNGAVLVGIDITGHKRAKESLVEHAAELERSNKELEQFAYVASHDLQEPLRMVSCYTQLLAKRYRDKLDGEADEFMGYILGGATRMYQLIQDLLAYSRVNTRGQAFAPTDCEAVLASALANLQVRRKESGAVVTHDPLPRVMADALQLGQLFQNLLGNALKFNQQQPPRVHVAAEPQGKEWLFSVRDNGIGIDAQSAERIFVIFQRLHSREAYPGTGIGLAICKKIVERHGGRIWVESQPGQGATFYFTLPTHRRREDHRKLTEAKPP